MAAIDILSFGIVAVDDTYAVDGLPAPDTKKNYLSSQRTGGGQSATALVAAARLGCSCRWLGRLGDNDLSDFTRRIFRREGIDFDPAMPIPEAEPFHSIILNDQADGSRTLLWNGDRVHAYEVGPVEMAMIDGAGCLFVDQGTPTAGLAAARRAAESGVPMVSDIEHFSAEEVREIAFLADHFIIPAAMAASAFGEGDPAAALGKALRFGRKSLVCITDGGRGSWFATAERPDEVHHQPAFRVEPVVDTNGCGDVFHGAYAASLVQGYPPAERIRRAAAAAALKVRRRGGQDAAPRADELAAFLAACA